MRIIFMGTPDFSVDTLHEIHKKGHEVVLVVTQPDKPKGRGNSVSFPPVKQAALDLGLEVFQPQKVREKECVEFLKSYKPDLIVVVAFGQILSKEILDMPKYGCINVHASLLPKYRGAAPIQWAVINGEKVSGVTIMRMDIGIDTGDMILKKEVPLDVEETGGSLFDKLAKVGGSLCVEAIEQFEQNTVVFQKQDDNKATHTKMIQKQFGKIDWSRPAIEIERLIRGLNPWPSAYTVLEAKTLKIWKARVALENTESESGTIVAITKNSIRVQTGDGILELLDIQLQGKKRMQTDAFLRGYKVDVDTKLE